MYTDKPVQGGGTCAPPSLPKYCHCLSVVRLQCVRFKPLSLFSLSHGKAWGLQIVMHENEVTVVHQIHSWEVNEIGVGAL